MLKTKKKLIEEPKVTKQPVIITKQANVDTISIVNKLNEVLNQLVLVAGELPKVTGALNTQLSENTKKSKLDPSWQDLQNIENKLSEIASILSTFTLNQKPESKIDLSPIVNALKAAQTSTVSTPKQWVFDIMKDNNGIYKVIANSKT